MGLPVGSLHDLEPEWRPFGPTNHCQDSGTLAIGSRSDGGALLLGSSAGFGSFLGFCLTWRFSSAWAHPSSRCSPNATCAPCPTTATSLSLVSLFVMIIGDPSTHSQRMTIHPSGKSRQSREKSGQPTLSGRRHGDLGYQSGPPRTSFDTSPMGSVPDDVHCGVWPEGFVASF